ncbi:MAG: helix-turn-helix domain-containing protein [Abitibacteriaceae bacterium]|nr:helix-turn-helix domain-containing protein [Abditibacteriaceae bacterium]
MARLSSRANPKQKPPARFSDEYGILLDLLIELRLKAGVTQQKMAEHLKTSQAHVSLWERREREISVMDVWGWCKATGISTSKFFSLFEQRLNEAGKKRVHTGNQS